MNRCQFTLWDLGEPDEPPHSAGSVIYCPEPPTVLLIEQGAGFVTERRRELCLDHADVEARWTTRAGVTVEWIDLDTTQPHLEDAHR